MKKAIALLLLLTFPLSGCAVFQSKKIDKLDERVTSVEEKQEALEDRLATDEEPEYRTNIEPKRKSPAKAGKTKVTLSKKEIQTALKNAGYYYGAIDGKIGRLSLKAIKQFQEDHGLKVDGIVGPRTTKELLRYLSEESIK
ncbi:MAG: hypothetical protein GF409_05555 [Candidatus Omnitrophica bacterium]|nr:hypothetical protein [Candidatus Omnitrophota bacterium]